MRKPRRADKVLLLNRERCNVSEIAVGLRLAEGIVCAVMERFGVACRHGASAQRVLPPQLSMREPDDALALLSLMNGEWPPAQGVRGLL